MWTLTQVPDADQMDEDIHRLVVIRGVEHKLLAKIKKSPLTHLILYFCKYTLIWNTLCHSIKFLLSEIKTRGYREQYKKTDTLNSAHTPRQQQHFTTCIFILAIKVLL